MTHTINMLILVHSGDYLVPSKPEAEYDGQCQYYIFDTCQFSSEVAGPLAYPIVGPVFTTIQLLNRSSFQAPASKE